LNYYTVKPRGKKMKSGSKEFNVILKISFFKNEHHRISFENQRMIFTNLEQSSKSFSVDLNEINNVYVYGNPIREIEIRTKSTIIIGSFKSTRTSNRALSILMGIFKKKLVHIYQ
jgi:uncharacterized 2Fe-2S/4Fe-4S cluster protein (DUF4445 family)